MVPRVISTCTLATLSLAALLVAVCPALGADVPQAIIYQGKLTDSSGQIVSDGAYSMCFKLFDAQNAGNQLWDSSTMTVAVSAGVFTVELQSISSATLITDSIWLETTIASSALPRVRLLSAPFALRAGEAANAWSLTGNAGTDPATNFIGTTDLQGFEIRVNTNRALRIDPFDDGWTRSANVIAGWAANSVAPYAYGATIAGGGGAEYDGEWWYDRPNTVSGSYGTVAGGYSNSAAGYSAVGGGSSNSATGWSSTVAGGYGNSAASDCCTVGGGFENSAANGYSTVGGGYQNSAAGWGSTVAGGTSNSAGGDYSFAAGQRAKANHSGAFVWADSTGTDFVSTAPNQLLIRASGNVGIGTTAPQSALDVAGSVTMTGLNLTTGAGKREGADLGCSGRGNVAARGPGRQHPDHLPVHSRLDPDRECRDQPRNQLQWHNRLSGLRDSGEQQPRSPGRALRQRRGQDRKHGRWMVGQFGGPERLRRDDCRGRRRGLLGWLVASAPQHSVRQLWRRGRRLQQFRRRLLCRERR